MGHEVAQKAAAEIRRNTGGLQVPTTQIQKDPTETVVVLGLKNLLDLGK